MTYIWHCAQNYQMRYITDCVILILQLNIYCKSVGEHPPLHSLRPSKMAAIWQTTFSNAFPWMKIHTISLKFVPKGPINNIRTSVQIMAWRRSGDKTLSKPTMVSLLTHISVTRPQWVNSPPNLVKVAVVFSKYIDKEIIGICPCGCYNTQTCWYSTICCSQKAVIQAIFIHGTAFSKVSCLRTVIHEGTGILVMLPFWYISR